MSKLITNNHNLNPKTNLKYRSYKFSLDIIRLTISLPKEKIYWVIGDQLLRSATSIGANIIEAIASSSKKDFIKFYQISLKSANETMYWLCLLRDSDLIDKEKISKHIQEATELAKMIATSLLTMKGKRS